MYPVCSAAEELYPTPILPLPVFDKFPARLPKNTLSPAVPPACKNKELSWKIIPLFVGELKFVCDPDVDFKFILLLVEIWPLTFNKGTPLALIVKDPVIDPSPNLAPEALNVFVA